MKLRQYQVDSIAEVVSHLGELGTGSGVMLQSATGSGKTVMGVKLLEMWMEQFPELAHAWVTHRRELRKQSGQILSKNDLDVMYMSDAPPNKRAWYPGTVNVVSPGLRRWPVFTSRNRPGLMVVDEAHHTPAATWARLVTRWQNKGGVVVGLTATPWRLSKQQGFTQWYDRIVCGPTIHKLQEDEYLARPRLVNPPNATISDEDAKLMSTGDYAFDWMEESVASLLSHKPVCEHLLEKTKKMRDKRTMWFVPTVHCAHMLKQLLEYKTGEESSVLTGDTPPVDRDRMLAALRKGRLTHLISVDVLGEGVDLPSVPIIASLRTTKSLAVWLQQCGRGSRPKGKDKAGHYTVLDYAGNAQRHGTPDCPREWFLEPRSVHAQGMAVPPTAQCHSCLLYTSPSPRDS